MASVTPMAALDWAPPQNDVPVVALSASAARESSAASAPAPGGIGDLGRFWREVKDLLQRRSPMIAAALEHAAVSSATDGLMALVLPEKFQCEQVEKNRAKVETAMQEVAGTAIRLEVKQGQVRGAVMPSTVRSEADAADVDRRRREEEARKHPMIQKAQDVFGAKVTGIKT